jgi:RNA polymerase sigma-70 factor, ECF subfamily
MRAERDEQALHDRRNESFDALLAQYGDRIYRFCHRLCGNATDAEDLTQEVFVAAFEGLPRFQHRSSLETWLYRIAVFRWRAQRDRRKPPTVPLDEAQAADAAAPDPARASLSRMELERALAALPEPLRQAFILVKAEGLRCHEAAAVLGIPEGTLKYRVYQAIHRLRALLAAEEADAPAPRKDPRSSGGMQWSVSERK